MGRKHLYLPLSKVSAGMMLSDEILDKQGHALLPAGALLNDNMITSIANHDIHHLSVFAEENPTQEADDELLRQKHIARLDVLFRHQPYEGATNELFQIIKKYRMGQST